MSSRRRVRSPAPPKKPSRRQSDDDDAELAPKKEEKTPAFDYDAFGARMMETLARQQQLGSLPLPALVAPPQPQQPTVFALPLAYAQDLYEGACTIKSKIKAGDFPEGLLPLLGLLAALCATAFWASRTATLTTDPVPNVSVEWSLAPPLCFFVTFCGLLVFMTRADRGVWITSIVIALLLVGLAFYVVSFHDRQVAAENDAKRGHACLIQLYSNANDEERRCKETAAADCKAQHKATVIGQADVKVMLDEIMTAMRRRMAIADRANASRFIDNELQAAGLAMPQEASSAITMLPANDMSALERQQLIWEMKEEQETLYALKFHKVQQLVAKLPEQEVNKRDLLRLAIGVIDPDDKCANWGRLMNETLSNKALADRHACENAMKINDPVRRDFCEKNHGKRFLYQQMLEKSLFTLSGEAERDCVALLSRRLPDGTAVPFPVLPAGTVYKDYESLTKQQNEAGRIVLTAGDQMAFLWVFAAAAVLVLVQPMLRFCV